MDSVKAAATAADKTPSVLLFCNIGLDTQSRGHIIWAMQSRDPGESMEKNNTAAATGENPSDTERLAAIGKVASKVAHELNNPMDGILRYINLAIRSMEQGNVDKPKQYLFQCRQGLMRMVQIVSELLEFSRSAYVPLEHGRVEPIIEEAVKTMEARAQGCDVRMVLNCAGNTPPVKTSNLFQVFCNLIKNALDSMPDGGQLYISTDVTQNNQIVIEFRDTGTGFDPNHSEAIFEPFFSTKHKGKGTGLGLAICRDIIERHNGRITAENAPDGGAVFRVYLPITEQDK